MRMGRTDVSENSVENGQKLSVNLKKKIACQKSRYSYDFVNRKQNFYSWFYEVKPEEIKKFSNMKVSMLLQNGQWLAGMSRRRGKLTVMVYTCLGFEYKSKTDRIGHRASRILKRRYTSPT